MKQTKYPVKSLCILLVGILCLGLAASCSARRPADPDKVVKIAVGSRHVAGLTAGGKVLFSGTVQNENDRVKDWTDIQDIAAGGFMTLGLRRDGTAVLAGTLEGMGIDGLPQAQWDDVKRLNVSSWEGIQAVGASKLMVFGLRKDGTVASDGVGFYKKVADGTAAWTDITAISVGETSVMGLKKDGTVVVSGISWGSGTMEWTDIRAVFAGNDELYGLKKDGTVVAQGFAAKASRETATRWPEVVKIVFNASSVIGLKKDGTILTAGLPVNNAGRMAAWSGLIDIQLSSSHVVGLKSDGTVVSTKQEQPVIRWD